MIFAPTFASGPNFLDPQTYSDGSAYGPRRYKEIIKECWYISDNTNTSYTDVLDISSIERAALLDYINKKHEATKKAMEDARQQVKKK